jgi:hypothetical protein
MVSLPIQYLAYSFEELASAGFACSALAGAAAAAGASLALNWAAMRFSFANSLLRAAAS